MGHSFGADDGPNTFGKQERVEEYWCGRKGVGGWIDNLVLLLGILAFSEALVDHFLHLVLLILFLNGSNPVSFCLFSFFSYDKCNINLTTYK